MAQGTTLESRETGSLIGSDKVEGTAVYRSNGERAGQIERIMIDKLSGKVAYAVMSFGGFMGIGEDYYPLPWSLLTYNPQLGGYEVNIGEEQLKGAPKYSKHESWDWSDRERGRKVYDYYGRAALLGFLTDASPSPAAPGPPPGAFFMAVPAPANARSCRGRSWLECGGRGAVSPRPQRIRGGHHGGVS